MRFLTCGSVDDGKSTLIGRLLYDTKLLFEDTLAALKRTPTSTAPPASEIDFALLVDGLEAEREQGITIDVAYRFFATDKRKFIVADTPGHEQYTRNMATGASNSDLAVILIDARKGVLTQTRRHAYIASPAGHPPCRAGGQQDRPGRLSRKPCSTGSSAISPLSPTSWVSRAWCDPDFRPFRRQCDRQKPETPWYRARRSSTIWKPSTSRRRSREKPFRMPVQWVNRPNLDFRGFSGTIAGGTRRGRATRRGRQSGRDQQVARIVTMDGDLAEAVPGEAVTLTLADEVDISRGDLLCGAEARPEVSDQFAAHMLWMAEEAMLPGPANICSSSAPHGSGFGHRAQAQGGCQHVRAYGRQRP